MSENNEKPQSSKKPHDIVIAKEFCKLQQQFRKLEAKCKKQEEALRGIARFDNTSGDRSSIVIAKLRYMAAEALPNKLAPEALKP